MIKLIFGLHLINYNYVSEKPTCQSSSFPRKGMEINVFHSVCYLEVAKQTLNKSRNLLVSFPSYTITRKILVFFLVIFLISFSSFFFSSSVFFFFIPLGLNRVLSSVFGSFHLTFWVSVKSSTPGRFLIIQGELYY